MLESIRLTNFMRHRDLTVSFTPGLNVIRAMNEGGKTTVLRAISYALFGTRATDLASDELVTWGEKPASMRVELRVGVDGVSYLITRSPTGAEVYFTGRDAPDVVGQNEVSNFASRLLGMDASAMTHLILATQGNIRGTLDKGPAATVELIEELADLTQIDKLIQLIGEHLPVGSTAMQEQRLATYQENLAQAKAAPPVDLDQLRSEVASREIALATASASLKNAISATQEATRTLLDEQRRQLEISKAAAQRVSLTDRIADADRNIERLRDEAAQPVQNPTDFDADIAAAQDFIDQRKLRDKVLAFADVECFDATLDEVKAEQALLQRTLSEARKEHQSVSVKIATLKAQRISSSVCGLCDKDVSELPQVKAKNAEIDTSLLACTSALEHQAQMIAADEAELAEVSRALELDANIRSTYAHIAQMGFIHYDEARVPTRPYWCGPDVSGELPDIAALRAKRTQLEQAHNDARAAGRALSQLQEDRQRLVDELNHLSTSDSVADPGYLDVLAAQKARHEEIEEVVKAQHQAAVEAHQRAVNALTRGEAESASQAAAKTQLETLIAQTSAELDEITFNNTLLKAIRAARPLVAEHVWNMVLAAVSTYFTQMRGTPSHVERKGKQFLVNGTSISGLSGSTKDVLGLAIRFALTRTFLPEASFTVLDEPAAACDDDRTSALLGFLQGAGFGQVLLVTHEEASMTMADNLIALGGVQ